MNGIWLYPLNTFIFDSSPTVLDDSTHGVGRWPVIMKRNSKSRSRSRSRSRSPSTSALSAETLDLNGLPMRLSMVANPPDPEMSESPSPNVAIHSSSSIFEFGQQLEGFAAHGDPEAEPNQSAEDENLCHCQELLEEICASSDAAQCVVQDVTWTIELRI